MIQSCFKSIYFYGVNKTIILHYVTKHIAF